MSFLKYSFIYLLRHNYLKIIPITTNITMAAPINGKKATINEKIIGNKNHAATNNIAKSNISLKIFMLTILKLNK